jgi:hypothetical protein
MGCCSSKEAQSGAVAPPSSYGIRSKPKAAPGAASTVRVVDSPAPPSTTTTTPQASLIHSASAIGLEEMIETRRENGDLGLTVVNIEIQAPFGKSIHEVYDGVHTGKVLGKGEFGEVRRITHRATGVPYAVKCLDLRRVKTAAEQQQLREEIFIMCQCDHPNIGT